MDIGKFSMVGSSERTCIHSEWTGNKPACYGLNQENDYASKKTKKKIFVFVYDYKNRVLKWKRLQQYYLDIRMDR